MPFDHISLRGNIRLQAAQGKPGVGEKQSRPRQLSILAYNGGLLNITGFDLPVVIDYDGLDIPRKVPILAAHDHAISATIGQGEAEVEDGQMFVSGPVMNDSETARQIVAMADQGYEWQASVGCDVQQVEKVAKGGLIEVNGMNFKGPLIVARRSVIREVSVLPVGADVNTLTLVASGRFGTPSTEGTHMPTFEEFLATLGLDPAAMSDAVKAALQVSYQTQYPPDDNVEAEGDEDIEAEGDEDLEAEAESDEEAEGDEEELVTAGARINLQAHVKAQRKAAAGEVRRVAAITRICANHPKIAAKAIEAGWSSMKAENQVLKANRPQAPNVHIRSTVRTPQVLEAGLAMAGGLGNLEKHFSEQTLDVADRQYRGSLRLQQVLLEAAHAGGCDERFLSKSNLRPVLQAAFSTASLPGILSNTANKFLLEGYRHVEQTWQMIAAIGNVNDFKVNSRYRMTDGGKFEPVGPGGELKHGTLGEEEYLIQADTYGRLYAITRQMIINDDLDALSKLPKQIGRQAGLKFNDVFWTEFLDNSTFFSSGNLNYFTGADSVLGSESLSTAVTKFKKQTDNNGDPVGIMPEILLVPPELETSADELYSSLNITTGGGSTKDRQPDKNVHANKYKPACSAYLSNSTYTGYSSTAWYLLGSPEDMPVIEAAFLDGQREPTIESADADFNTLGIQMRGYFDFGVAKQEYRGGAKSKGAA